MDERDENPSSAAEAKKIAVVLREDLEPWQRLNVAAFTVSGVAGLPNVLGAPYRDASGLVYLPMFREPVLIFGVTATELSRTAERARARELVFSIFTEQLFETLNDEDNRAAVAEVPTPNLAIVGLAFRCDRKMADKILKGIKLIR